MKIAISSSGTTLGSALDPRFGRCAYFLIVDPADMGYAVFDNQSAAQGSGAGIQAAQFLADKKVGVVITGHVGPNAVQTLAAAGIQIFVEQQGTVEEVVEKYKQDGLKTTTQSTVDSHFGMGSGAGPAGRKVTGMPSGGGRGLGQGSGRGMRQGSARMGQGTGRGMGRCGS